MIYEMLKKLFQHRKIVLKISMYFLFFLEPRRSFDSKKPTVNNLYCLIDTKLLPR